MKFLVTVAVEGPNNFAQAFAAAKKKLNEGDAFEMLASQEVEVKPDRRRVDAEAAVAAHIGGTTTSSGPKRAS